jgi:natural product precursor
MKKLSKLKLNVLSEANLLEKEMNILKGGNFCTCSCYYEGNGGSSSGSNMNANISIGTGGYSSNGCNQYAMATEASGYLYCPYCNESDPGPH